jgi:hypothetical protein
MAADPQDTLRHAGLVVRHVLLRRNIVIDAETAQLVAAPSRRRFRPVRPPGHRAEDRAFLLPIASRCSDAPPGLLASFGAGDTFGEAAARLPAEAICPARPLVIMRSSGRRWFA